MTKRSVVVILGASSGIGRATALAFARQGDAVVLAARSAAALEDVAEECRQSGVVAGAVPTDATDPQAVRALFARALEQHGRVDVWVNIVGLGAIGRFDDTPLEAHRRVIETNLIGGMNGAHAVMPYFRERGQGTLIQMISVGAWTPAPYATAYTASKFGLRGFIEALQAEVSDLPDVHVCGVYPTVVDTPGFSHGANYSGHQMQPGGPMLDPREVADGIVQLAHAPKPSLYLGSLAWPSKLAHALAPSTTGRMLRMLLDRSLKHGQPALATHGNLFEPSVGHAIDGGLRAPRSSTRKTGAVTALAIGGLALGWWLTRRPARL